MSNPDITITVNYDPNGSPKITLDPSEPVHVETGTTAIWWQLGDAPPNTLLVGTDNWQEGKPLGDEHFYITPSNKYGGTDTNEATEEEHFSYDVIVYAGGVRIEDPEIVNDPGGGGRFRLHHPKPTT